MKESIAVISDIHGNIDALEAVLHDIDYNTDISSIYCLGDLIGIGPYTNEVLDSIFFRENIHVVSGNHEEAVLALIQGTPYPTRSEKVRTHHEWVAEYMNPDFIPRLASLPRRMTIELGDLKSLMPTLSYEVRKYRCAHRAKPF
ncbi:metallophosphoesterase family protein [Halobacillus andaensis]|uniref:metallophosphoesterase family protein n=1 Tax=Halobacillus andaensis TaxID=1176239 RepID=UPI003D73DFCD